MNNYQENALHKHKHHVCPSGHTATVLVEDIDNDTPVFQLDSKGRRQYSCQECLPPRIFSVDLDGQVVLFQGEQNNA